MTDLAALARELDALPPRPIRPRVEAELVRVIAVAGVQGVTYAPGDQRLDAVITDTAGTTATIRATHTGAAPAASTPGGGARRGEASAVRQRRRAADGGHRRRRTDRPGGR